MRVTRSTTRAVATAGVEQPVTDAPASKPTTAPGRKRKAADQPVATESSSKKPRKAIKKKSNPEPEAANTEAAVPRPQIAVVDTGPQVLVPAKLTFSFEDAKQHLIAADSRFEDIFRRMPCRPYEHLEQVDPFRTLTISILGQQISWLAARSIVHKFVRLFNPSLPEKPVGHSNPTDFFPAAQQVAVMNVQSLRPAGLSQRKAEYVLDLAGRFADGRLSTQKVLEAGDEELYEMLTAVRGIGRWTVDMFAIFSLRRPDILPVGDLGVQRGLLRWVLARHSSSFNIDISPKKLPQAPSKEKTEDDDVLPVLGETSKVAEQNEEPDNVGVSSIPPIPTIATPATPVPAGKKGKSKALSKKKADSEDTDTDEDRGLLDLLPTPFTPSFKKVLNKPSESEKVPPLPAGLTVAEMKKRLVTKKKIKGALLTPVEMEALTEPWKPYRAVGVYFMWALAEEPK